MRKIQFTNGQFYHIYNRGTDKRQIFNDERDAERFLRCMTLFNTIKPGGGLYAESFPKEIKSIAPPDPLVHFVAYCLNPNHFHLVVEQVTHNGISNFMKRLLGGYSGYFNKRYERTGTLFEGRFKAIHIDSHDYLLYLSAYVNLNDRCHRLDGRPAKLVRSSWGEYIGRSDRDPLCLRKGLILSSFKSVESYCQFALRALEEIIRNKKQKKELEDILRYM